MIKKFFNKNSNKHENIIKSMFEIEKMGVSDFMEYFRNLEEEIEETENEIITHQSEILKLMNKKQSINRHKQEIDAIGVRKIAEAL